MPRTVAAAITVLFFTAAPAYAYIDPGAGSLFLQLILGGIGGLLVAGRIFWRRIRFGRDKTE